MLLVVPQGTITFRRLLFFSDILIIYFYPWTDQYIPLLIFDHTSYILLTGSLHILLLLFHFFKKDRTLLNDLFDAASFTILSWFNVLSKMECFVTGIVCTLHTFGRDLKWNSHIHMIVTEGAMGRLTHWKSFDFLPFYMLRKRFMTKLLFNLSKKILFADFKKIKSNLYKENSKGFYVHAPKKQNSNISSILNILLVILVDLLWPNLVFYLTIMTLLLFIMIGMKITKELKRKFTFLIFLKNLLFIFLKKAFI